MAVGQDEAVAVRPDRIGGVEAQIALPQAVRDRRERHRCSRMPGVGGLYGVHCQRADRVDGELVEVGLVSHGLAPDSAFLTYAGPRLPATVNCCLTCQAV